MTTQPETTLAGIRKNLKERETFRVADFVTKKELEQLHENNKESRLHKDPKFDENDAFVAEIMARFGYDAYVDWNMGSIDQAKIERLLAAERAREQALMLPLASIVMNMVSACIKVSKKEKKPKGPKQAVKVFKQMVKIAKGEA